MVQLRLFTAMLVVLCSAVALRTGPALAQSVSVTLNGAPLFLNPAPQERAGRIFVPLRGVFERLGASVVYENGTINAQGNGHSISLQIGSNQAEVDGNQQTLDVAPFVIGGSTYVPLRFVSQALGASVDYDASNRIVALAGGSQQQSQSRGQQWQQQQDRQRAQQQQQAQADQQRAQVDQQRAQDQQYAQQQQQQVQADRQRALDQQYAQQQQQQAQQQQQQQRLQDQQRTLQQQPSALTFAAVHPGRGETVSANRPSVEADFGTVLADPTSIRVTIDGINVTDQTSRSPRGVVFSPPSDLQPGQHGVRVTGNDSAGRPFDGRWTFVSGTVAVSNSITDLRPGNGSTVRGQFVVSGRTMPGSRVVVQVGTVNQQTAEDVIGQLLNIGNGNGNGSARSEVFADGNGNFQIPVDIQARSGQQLTLTVDSTEARSQAAAPRVVRHLTME